VSLGILPTDTLEERVKEELDRLRQRARQLVSRASAGPIHLPFFEDAGKLLRPRLVFLAIFHGEELGEKVDVARGRDAALAIELCHVGSLYHDDVADRSPIRRGVPAMHNGHGVRVASLAGAHLVALGNALVAGFPCDLARAWGDTGVRMTEGQLRDIERTGSIRGTIEDFVNVCWKKTGAAFELAAILGASVGGLAGPERDALVRFARHLGIAFQLFDDLNDFVPQPGKHRPRANDLRERVYTLPVLYGAAQDTATAKRVRDLLRNDGRPLAASVASEVCELLAESGAFEAAARRTVEEQEAAAMWLDRLEATQAREGLRALLDRLKPPANLSFAVRGPV